MNQYESIHDRIKAVDLLLENGYASPSAFLMRSVIEHIANTMLIDNGLWKQAIGKNENLTTPKLSRSINLIRENCKDSGLEMNLLKLIKNFGDDGAHNSAVSLSAAKGCRYFLDSIIENFSEKYPDEVYLHDFSEFSVPLIEVTSLFVDRTIALKSIHNNKFFSVNIEKPDAPVSCTVKKADSWEYLRVRATDDGYIGFLCANDKWLSANDNDLLLANAEKLCLWECFRIYKTGKTYCILSAKNKKWFSLYRDDKNNIVNVNSQSPEKNCNYFSIKIIE